MSKICNDCGKSVDDGVKFCPYCKSQSFRTNNEVTTGSDSLVHKLFYWNYGGRYVLSKSKLVGFLVFLLFATISINAGEGVGIVVFSAILGFLTFFLGFAIHKMKGEPNEAKIKHNDYGLIPDLIHLLFFWQNDEGGFALAKSKIISHIVFVLVAIIGSALSPPSVFAVILIGLVLEIPVFVIGYGVHKLTNPNPEAKPIEAKPKKKLPKKEKPKEVPKPEPETPKWKIIPEYLDYQLTLDELNSRFRTKDEHVRDLIEKRFEPPQLTYTRFIGIVDKSAEVFKKNSDSCHTMITLADDYSKRIADEIESKIGVLNSIIERTDDLINELVLNEEDSQKSDVEDLITEMDNLISSVKDY